MILTPLHFVELLTAQGCIYSDTDIPSKHKSLSSIKLLKSIRSYAEFFADLATQMASLRSYKCSEIGTACIMCSRHINGINPIWSRNIGFFTGQTQEQVEAPYSLLFNFYQKSFNIPSAKGVEGGAADSRHQKTKVNLMEISKSIQSIAN